jgi:type IV pilus assembly protein PilB
MHDQLGDILVRKGELDRHEMARVAVEARAAGERLGEFLVASGLVYEDAVAQALAEQFGLRYTNIDQRDLHPALANVLPVEVAKRLSVVPLSFSSDCVIIAVADPTDVYMVDELRMLVHAPLELVVAEKSVVGQAILTVYRERPEWLDRGEETTTVARRGTVIDQHDGEGDAEAVPAVEAVNDIIRRAIKAGASDVHWVPRHDDLLVRARVDGVMRELEVVPLRLRAPVVARLKVMAQLDIAERRLPQDGRFAVTFDGVPLDLRVAVLPSTHGEEVVLRLAYVGQTGHASFEELGMASDVAAVIRHALRSPAGAVVIAAPTGSGKTTTLYAALAELNDGSRNIITIEDPVERDVPGAVQIEVNDRSGLTFERGLRTILRADPDVILVGEIRDTATAEIALQAAMTGHLVLTTVHAESAAAGIVRLRQLGVDPILLSSSIRCLVSQRLLRRLCVRCADVSGDEPQAVSGCQHCDHIGYAGRVPVYEALEMTDAVRQTVAGSAAQITAATAEQGRKSLRDAAVELVRRGVTTDEEVARVCGEAT